MSARDHRFHLWSRASVVGIDLFRPPFGMDHAGGPLLTACRSRGWSRGHGRGTAGAARFRAEDRKPAPQDAASGAFSGARVDWTSGSATGAHRGTPRFPQVGGLIAGNPWGGCPICLTPCAARPGDSCLPRETRRRPSAPPARRAPAVRCLPVPLLPAPPGCARWTRFRPELGEEAIGRWVSSTTGRWSACGSVMTCRPPGNRHDQGRPARGGFFLPRRRRARDASGTGWCLARVGPVPEVPREGRDASRTGPYGPRP